MIEPPDFVVYSENNLASDIKFKMIDTRKTMIKGYRPSIALVVI